MSLEGALRLMTIKLHFALLPAAANGRFLGKRSTCFPPARLPVPEERHQASATGGFRDAGAARQPPQPRVGDGHQVVCRSSATTAAVRQARREDASRVGML